jgi:hypothetical protein
MRKCPGVRLIHFGGIEPGELGRLFVELLLLELAIWIVFCFIGIYITYFNYVDATKPFGL